jgi:hypothetical protein
MLSVATIPGFSLGLGQQLHATLHPDSLCALAKIGPALSLKKLWDSRWELSSYGDSRNSLLPGIQALVYGTAPLSLNYYPREKIEILKVIFSDFKSDPLHCLLGSTLFASVGRHWFDVSSFMFHV